MCRGEEKTYAEIELHAQSCDELQEEWNGDVLECVNVRGGGYV